MNDAPRKSLDIQCQQCWDSFIEIDMYGPATCKQPHHGISAAATRISEVVVARIATEKKIDPAMLDAARSLANATAENPIPGVVLMAHLNCDRRRLSELMQRLCDEWALPAIASRQPPYGYYIAVTADQLDAWSRGMRSQAISELARVHHLKRTCYPLLAGQQPFDFIEQVSSELQEAIR
jgi:hypothetical protein